MAKGYAFYKDIQGKMRDAAADEDYREIQQLIAKYKSNPYQVKAMVNTLEHVWGYFKKSAEEEDKKHFFSLLHQLSASEIEKMDDIPNEMMLFLHYLLEKYPSDYLKQSTFIKK
ncbi:DUF1722 domain-containing protein [Fictibacillus barbaricus]|uniref:Uncharacterized protein YbgA (DUF1722 family) n=1 Tax=Fictibacillus barbaricus TaxID=182136 RepID=A0ABU1U1Z5_9BACL|nr:DUF1722 domain-containing protein [Fictibacillus barbaricus]MDR7073511.1 uncharacterized protein YbgA (DUF1722 family) [Fictibacillus barbaricus]